MRKSQKRLSTLVVFVLLIAMIAMILVSSTYAKYVSTASVSGSAVVAKWSVEVNDTDIASAPQSLSINLFDTVLDTADEGNTETNIADSTGTMIAPGTYGCFELTITNKSDVTANIVASFSVTNDDSIPLLYAVGDSDSTIASLDWKTDVRDLDIDTELDYEGGTTPEETVYIYWMWEFENTSTYGQTQTDASDTALGISGSSPSVTLTVDITATQVD